ncbi:MAG: FAD-dependent oxidoreductase [Bacillota bacterium]|nr:FAD-dependent oxidoreductase [Bacillota bacterium]
MDKKITLPPMSIRVRAITDVLIAGGGLAGVAAALAAARTGARTILVERNSFLGGVATAGMCCSIFNCLYDINRQLVVKGIPLEIVDLLADAGGPGSSWHRHKGHIIYDIELGKLALAELLANAGVTVLLESPVVQVVKTGARLTGVVVKSRNNLEAIMAGVIVDATGDSEVAFLADAPLNTLPWTAQSRSSYVFRIGNVDVDRFVQYFRDHPDQYPADMDVEWTLDEALAQYDENGTFLFPHGGGMQLDLVKQGVASGAFPRSVGSHDTIDAMQMHALREQGVVHIITGHVQVNDLDSQRISQAILDGKKMAFQVTDYFKHHMPGFAKAFVTATADNLGIRASRWIKGDFTFTADMKNGKIPIDDSIGSGVVEEHYKKNKADRAWSVQAFTDRTYNIPYRCLLPKKVTHLIMGAGRSISAENPYLLRVMVTTMVVGQGAGTAAALCAREQISPEQLPIDMLQQELLRAGVLI